MFRNLHTCLRATFLGIACLLAALPASAQQEYTQLNWLRLNPPGAGFGSRMSISGDAQTLAGYANNQVAIFKRSGKDWTQETVLTTGFANLAKLSADGKTLVTGNQFANSFKGKLTVWRRGTSAWAQDAELTLDPADKDALGILFYVSADGTVILAHARDNANLNRAYTFIRAANGTWSTTAATMSFVGNEVSPSCVSSPSSLTCAQPPYRVAGLSGDGSTAVFEKNLYDWNTYVIYKRSGTSWVLQQQLDRPVVVLNNLTYDGNRAEKAWLSHDGRQLIESQAFFSFNYTQGVNAGIYFSVVEYSSDSNGNWSSPNVAFTASATSGNNSGYAVGAEVSADGNTIATGDANSNTPGVLILRKTNGSWTQIGGRYTPCNSAFFTAVSGNGNVVLTGCPTDNLNVGAIVPYEFQVPPSVTKAFTPASIARTTESTLTYTITPPASLSGVAFSDTLPSQTPLSSNPSVSSSNCGTPAVTAVANTTGISITGAVLTSNLPCKISMRVTGTTDGAWESTSGQLTSNEQATASGASGSLSVTAITDVSAQSRITSSGFTPSAADSTIRVGRITLTNKSTTAITGPVSIVFDNLPSGVTVVSPTGYSSGSPYVKFSSGTIAPSGSVTVQIGFRNPSNAALSVPTKVFSGMY